MMYVDIEEVTNSLVASLSDDTSCSVHVTDMGFARNMQVIFVYTKYFLYLNKLYKYNNGCFDQNIVNGIFKSMLKI